MWKKETNEIKKKQNEKLRVNEKISLRKIFKCEKRKKENDQELEKKMKAQKANFRKKECESLNK